MVKINSTSRLFSIESRVLLTQTDTTVGFLSQNADKLRQIKQRSSQKPFIKVYKSFQTLKLQLRVPKSQRAMVRRTQKTTFIVKGISFRIAKERLHSALLRQSEWNYSTSANESGKSFNREFCEEKADIIVQDKNSLFEEEASSLYKINHKKRIRLR